MPARVDGFTSTDPNTFAPFEFRAFLNWFNKTASNGTSTVTDETFTVPSGKKWSLLHVPFGDITKTANIDIWDAAGGTGNQFTVLADGANVSPGVGEVLCRRGTAQLEFNTADIGTEVFVTYKTKGSALDAAFFAHLCAHIARGGQFDARVVAAGEDLVAGPGFVLSGLAYQSDMESVDPAKVARYWILAPVSAAADATLLRVGSVVSPRTVPTNVPIFMGRSNSVTWATDDEAAYKPVTMDYKSQIGWSEDGTNIILAFNDTLDRWA